MRLLWILVWAAIPCKAALLYSQGAAATTFSRSDEPDFGRRIADDFELGATVTVRGVNWQGLYHPTGNPTSTDNFTIYFYADGAGTPFGAPIASYNVGNAVSRTPAGFTTSGFNHPVYDYGVDLGSGIPIPANTRTWISIVNDTSGSGVDWGWVTDFPASSEVFHQSRGSTDGGATWSESYANNVQTFSLHDVAVPEPSLPLLSALGLMAALRRRRA